MTTEMTTQEKIESLRQRIAEAEAELPQAEEDAQRLFREWYKADRRRVAAMEKVAQLRGDINRWRGSLRQLQGER